MSKVFIVETLVKEIDLDNNEFDCKNVNDVVDKYYSQDIVLNESDFTERTFFTVDEENKDDPKRYLLKNIYSLMANNNEEE